MVHQTKHYRLRTGRIIVTMLVLIAIISIITTITLTILALTPHEEESNSAFPKKASDTVIVIDPGHGWTDPGAIRNMVEERMLNASLSYKLAKELQSHGYQVFFSHDISYATDVPSDIPTLLPKIEAKYDIQNELVPAINEKNPHIMVSIHHNAMPEEEHPLTGFEAFYSYNDSMQAHHSIMLAQSITSSMTNLDFLSPKENPVVQAEYLINDVSMPSVLLEVGYMSNAEELSKLIISQNQDEIAKEISSGIIDFFESN